MGEVIRMSTKGNAQLSAAASLQGLREAVTGAGFLPHDCRPLSSGRRLCGSAPGAGGGRSEERGLGYREAARGHTERSRPRAATATSQRAAGGRTQHAGQSTQDPAALPRPRETRCGGMKAPVQLRDQTTHRPPSPPCCVRRPYTSAFPGPPRLMGAAANGKARSRLNSTPPACAAARTGQSKTLVGTQPRPDLLTGTFLCQRPLRSAVAT